MKVREVFSKYWDFILIYAVPFISWYSGIYYARNCSGAECEWGFFGFLFIGIIIMAILILISLVRFFISSKKDYVRLALTLLAIIFMFVGPSLAFNVG